MNRPYSIHAVLEFCAEARNRLGPRLMLGADIITGFPGETESDFAQTETFLFDSPAPITNLHVFPYSERPGTPAATFTGALPPDIRRARAHTLDTRARTARLAFARTFVGQDVEVCIEKGGLHGWTGEYLPCRLAGAPAERRALITCRVNAVAPDGTLITNPTQIKNSHFPTSISHFYTPLPESSR